MSDSTPATVATAPPGLVGFLLLLLALLLALLAFGVAWAAGVPWAEFAFVLDAIFAGALFVGMVTSYGA